MRSSGVPPPVQHSYTLTSSNAQGQCLPGTFMPFTKPGLAHRKLAQAEDHLKSSERKLNTNFFFSNFSGTSGISRQNPGISRQKRLISLVSRDIPDFSAPTPSRGRPPPHRRIFGPKSLGLGSFFFPEKELVHGMVPPCTGVDSMWMLTMALFGSRARVQKGDCVYSIVIA